MRGDAGNFQPLPGVFPDYGASKEQEDSKCSKLRLSGSFWDLVTPTEAAAMLRTDYGAHALRAAIECADAAKNDARDSDHRFWLEVANALRVDGPAVQPGETWN
jgi:hypothetical protein